MFYAFLIQFCVKEPFLAVRYNIELIKTFKNMCTYSQLIETEGQTERIALKHSAYFGKSTKSSRYSYKEVHIVRIHTIYKRLILYTSRFCYTQKYITLH